MENENILKDKRKRCIQWNVELPEEDCRISSKSFLFQKKNCYLEFHTGDYLVLDYPSLSFKYNGKMQLPLIVTLRVLVDYKTYSQEIISITSSDQVIWRYTDGTVLSDCHVTFELTFHADCSGDDKAVQTSPYIDTNIQLEAVSKDFSRLFDAGPNHDVEFLCGSETIKAHKDVISCRSTVFASMLGTDMLEGRTGKIKIEDIESSVLRQFLRYLYTGMLPHLTFDRIFHMYQVADKYAVDSLKEQCASFLSDNLSHENACEVLILSDRHKDLDLKNAVMRYMFKERIPRCMGEKWTDFSKENLALANEVLYRLYMNYSRIYHVSNKQ